jgi:hypothetical protein
MGYSNDLRVRVIRVVEGGVAARAAARQFVIGRSRSPLKKHEDWLLELVRGEPQRNLCRFW